MQNRRGGFRGKLNQAKSLLNSEGRQKQLINLDE